MQASTVVMLALTVFFGFLHISCGSNPPPAVNFTAVQSFNEIVVSWTSLHGEPNPITSYAITINGNTVTVAGNSNQYSHSIVDECGSTLEISMFATSAAGSGIITTTNLAIVAAPVDLSLCAVMEFNETPLTRCFLNAEWKMPLEQVPQVALIIEVSLSPLSSALAASTTMYQIEDVTFPGMFEVMVYFEGQKDSMCFSTSNQITVPKAFPLVTVTESTVSSEVAHFFIHLDFTAFIINNNDLVLSGGYGICGLASPSSQSLDLTCTGLNDGTSYNLMVNLSVEDNCLIILISFDTPTLTLPVSAMTPTTKPVSPTSTGTMMTSSASSCEVSVGLSLGLFVVSTIFMKASVLSPLITLLLTCMCVCGINKKATHTGAAPLYEIPSTDTEKESLRMSPCAEYGLVWPQSPAPSSSAHEAV